ncbi:hypothetical protein SBOR_3921 [Sclerotinia borealis F-4128]|uniref:IPT/TIG domain-containing protein n=1 Tax=Sclerotinia borealis (strain F-4128) TaxID=1432307 RepID=W9CIJ2_SCLBF|nr:hypothetical protein SBOR_3921 [Sclerotinia borealis F-4128]
MQAISESVSASSPPFILNSDMSGADSDPDFEFLDNSHMSFEATYSQNNLFEDFSHDSPPYYSAYTTPSVAGHKSPEQPSFINTAVLQAPLSSPSTASPAGSSHSSTSDSMEYNRKSGSDSSRSALNSGAAMMGDDIDMGDWKGDDMIKGESMSNFGDYAGNGTINPTAMINNFGFNDKSMENDFDFDSASSSPSPFATAMDMESPEMSTIKHDTPRKISPMQHSLVHSTNGYHMGSREASPLSVESTSQASSPAHHMFTNSPSPNVGLEFMSGIMPNAAHGLPPWTNSMEVPHNMMRTQAQFNPLSFQNTPQYKNRQNSGVSYTKPILTIHPTPLKSRVETQIPIKMTLFPVPQGVTKLHLPTQTISKPKLLVKPPPDRSPDTLELYTMLVCSSAMENPDILRKALERAAAPEFSPSQSSDSGSDEDDDRKPLNGGEVLICSGCITRERKRAARKKVKKVEEEESWHKDEAKRVIVFNTHEVKDWQSPTSQPPSEATGDRPEPFVPDGAMQVDAPMRIACYCRHQNEKIGFRVIFTIKDYQERLIAQAITSSIMITDDHKTHNLLPIPGQVSCAPDGQMFSGPTSYSNERNFDMTSGVVPGMHPFRVSPSASDLQNLPQNFMPYPQPMNYPPSNPPQTISNTMTPRHPSPQASPSTPSGPPLSKKRKASSSGKVPTGLAMTKLETGQMGMNIGPLVPVSAATSTIPSPFTPNLPNFPSNEQPFCQPAPPMQHVSTHYNTGPPTPNSNDQLYTAHVHRPQPTDNLAMHQLYSAPPSGHPSRVPSPNGMRNNVQIYQQQQQAHMAQAVANGIYGMPLTLSPQRPPVIHKLIPNEGPKAGGIEVTCLGSGFCQGLEVMFGDAKATTTTFWGETSLVCLLPPSAIAGTVPVTFKHQHQQRQQYPTPPMPKQTAFFKYVDDDEQQIIRTALAVLGHKMTGKMEDVRDLARRIVDGPWGAPSGQSPPSGGGSSQHGGGFNAASFGVDVEATLLRCLDLIDLDDSPTKPRFNLRKISGQTMLHLACSLGLHRFVAALLARNVNCEPRDKGGFTPMHFAALHNHPQIVRRLILSGADPLIRSLQGYAPGDMTSSEEVHRAVRRVEHHSRRRSGSSLKSRTSSATSLRSLWQPPNAEIPNESGISDSDDEDDNEYEDEDADVDTDAATDGIFSMRNRQSRRSSTKNILNETIETTKTPVLELPEVEADEGLASPTMAMTAFRDQMMAQFTAQMQHLQQSFHNGMHLGLPNLPQLPQMPQMPQMPTLANLPDYQAYLPSPMVRRIGSRPDSPERQDGAKEQGNKWWDLFSGNVALAPPAYEDIFPQSDVDVKRAFAEQAVAETIADNKCAQAFDQTKTHVEMSTFATRAESSTNAAQRKSLPMGTLRIGGKEVVTVEQQNQIQLLRQEKLKRVRSDRKLFLIWIPLLLVMMLATFYTRIPAVWSRASYVFTSLTDQNQDQGRVMEVL